jgi:nucleotide-binding universal stress UspA family protein
MIDRIPAERDPANHEPRLVEPPSGTRPSTAGSAPAPIPASFGRPPDVIDRVLIPLDGSALAEHAIPYALAVAAPTAALMLVRVAPRPSPAARLNGPGSTVLGAIEEQQDEVRRALEATARRIRAAAEGRTVDAIVAEGDPAHRIARVAADRRAHLVVMASHARGTLGRAIFGSVTDRVEDLMRLPVLIVRPQDVARRTTEAVRRIVVPIDNPDDAAAALPVAVAIARARDLPVVLLAAVDAYGPETPLHLASASAFDDELYERLLTEQRGTGQRLLNRHAIQAAASGVPVFSEVLTGDPVRAITDWVRDGDLIVVASHLRRGVTRLLVGSMAQRLVHAGPVPVVVTPADERPSRAQSNLRNT